jgi:YjbE family integral membrane protein
MTLPFLKLVGGVLLFWVAIKLVTEDSDGDSNIEAGETLWRAVRIVAIADIVMSLDNVIAIAASAERAASAVDLAHASAIKTTLIIFGLATSIPLIIAGSAILMALLDRFRVLVWAGGALLGWIAGEIMFSDPAVVGWLGENVVHHYEVWAGRFGALLVVAFGLLMMRRHRRLTADEMLAGIGLLIWIAGETAIDNLIGEADLAMRWVARGCVAALLVIIYALARSRRAVSAEEV